MLPWLFFHQVSAEPNYERKVNSCFEDHRKDVVNFIRRLDNVFTRLKSSQEVANLQLKRGLRRVQHSLNRIVELMERCTETEDCLNRCYDLRHEFNRNFHNLFKLIGNSKSP